MRNKERLKETIISSPQPPAPLVSPKGLSVTCGNNMEEMSKWGGVEVSIVKLRLGKGEERCFHQVFKCLLSLFLDT